MKRVLLLLLFAGVCLPGSAQKKNSLRAGAGINIINGAYEGYKNYVGPTVFLEYNRDLTKWIGVTAGVFTATNSFAESNELTEWNISVKAIFTPFHKRFRYFKLGTGTNWGNRTYFTKPNEDYPFEKTVWNDWGLNFTLRLYAIDNDRFELFGSYDQIWRGHDQDWCLSMGLVGIFFGVKF